MNWPQKEEEIEDGPAIIKISDERSIGKVLGKNGQTIQSIEVVCGTRVQINQQVDPAVVSVSGDKLGVLFTLWIISDIIKGLFQGFVFIRKYREFVRQVISDPAFEGPIEEPPKAIYVRHQGYILQDKLANLGYQVFVRHPPEAERALKKYFAFMKLKLSPIISLPQPAEVIVSGGLVDLSGTSQSTSTQLPTTFYTTSVNHQSIPNNRNVQTDTVNAFQTQQAMASDYDFLGSTSSAYPSKDIRNTQDNCLNAYQAILGMSSTGMINTYNPGQNINNNYNSGQNSNNNIGGQTSSALLCSQPIGTSLSKNTDTVLNDHVQNLLIKLAFNKNDQGGMSSPQCTLQNTPNSYNYPNSTPISSPTTTPIHITTPNALRGNIMNQNNPLGLQNLFSSYRLKSVKENLRFLNQESSKVKREFDESFN
eukprot:TRINITY_DN3152_c0_g1_i1.p2 TRINITY_DN3152_c0_g1~~TRINITY_DN3152_c0_g1_i1.p2  ORF type:complete len:423 (-),score=45.63 TRINITY_DN3152_c0_g1_i1:1139-2407(-)